ncbi:hypothetical protein BTI50_07875 [Lactobacillus delbrueckii subsp. bulgaricus]|nr:hypothetical protein [Lactobacillus delbrueckii subsp. bulgaricus]
MRTSSTSSGFWQESWKKMARLPGSAQKAIKKRALFGRFRSYLEYKCKSAGVKLVIANRFYPSTKRCAVCGNIKKNDEKITLSGNKKHGTKHNEYVCYNKKCPNYNKVVVRDMSAMMNLTFLIDHLRYNKAL